MRIRQADPSDTNVVVEFNALLARESEGKELDLDLLRPGVAAALADSNKALYFLAFLDGDEPQGQLMLTYEWSDWRNGWFFWIQSVYVREGARRQGIFRGLYEHVRALASKRDDVIGIRLYVEHDNKKAQETYTAMGMTWTSYGMLELYPLDASE